MKMNRSFAPIRFFVFYEVWLMNNIIRSGADILSKKRIITGVLGAVMIIAALVVGVILTAPKNGKHETIGELMVDAVMHDTNKVSLFGIMEVNPAVISAMTVTAVLLFAALLIRLFVIPRFTYVPGKFQALLESAVGLFDGMAQQNSSGRGFVLGAYVFSAGAYICLSTLFELFGIQVVSTKGISMSLPAPLADINGAIAMGVTSYSFILLAGVRSNGLRGLGSALKEFSLPISMSFRLFGALLSGLLVSELVYYYSATSYVIPVFVAVMFTLMHALIQAYVLTTLTSVFFGEVTEKHEKKKPEKKSKKALKGT